MDYQVLWLHNSIIASYWQQTEGQGLAVIMEHYGYCTLTALRIIERQKALFKRLTAVCSV